MKETIVEESWNKTRIAIAIILILLIITAFGLKTNFLLPLSQNNSKPSQPSSAKGASTQDELPNIGNAIESVKKEISNINVNEIASSSPQIQKVLNDIKNLQSYPANQVKETCFKICNGL